MTKTNSILEKQLEEQFLFLRKDKLLKRKDAYKILHDIDCSFRCECGDGWFDLLERMCRQIKEVNDGQGGEMEVRIDQIQEKHGRLQVDYSLMNADNGFYHEIERIITYTVHEAEYVCEVCGHGGRLRDDNGRYRTRCDECEVLERRQM